VGKIIYGDNFDTPTKVAETCTNLLERKGLIEKEPKTDGLSRPKRILKKLVHRLEKEVIGKSSQYACSIIDQAFVSPIVGFGLSSFLPASAALTVTPIVTLIIINQATSLQEAVSVTVKEQITDQTCAEIAKVCQVPKAVVKEFAENTLHQMLEILSECVCFLRNSAKKTKANKQSWKRVYATLSSSNPLHEKIFEIVSDFKAFKTSPSSSLLSPSLSLESRILQIGEAVKQYCSTLEGDALAKCLQLRFAEEFGESIAKLLYPLLSFLAGHDIKGPSMTTKLQMLIQTTEDKIVNELSPPAPITKIEGPAIPSVRKETTDAAQKESSSSEEDSTSEDEFYSIESELAPEEEENSPTTPKK